MIRKTGGVRERKREDDDDDDDEKATQLPSENNDH